MAIGKYEPAPVPLGFGQMTEYVQRELRRIGQFINETAVTGAPIGASYVTVDAEASLSNERRLSATAGLVFRDRSLSGYVLLDWNVGALTARSASVTELYLLAYDVSASAHVRVPVNALPSGGSSSLPERGVRLESSATYSMSTGTRTLSFIGVVRDDGGYWSSLAGDSIIVPANEAGWYVITASMKWGGATGNGRRLVITVDGVAVARASAPASSNHNDPALCCSTAIYLGVGAIVKAAVNANDTGVVNTDPVLVPANLSAVKIRPA